MGHQDTKKNRYNTCSPGSDAGNIFVHVPIWTHMKIYWGVYTKKRIACPQNMCFLHQTMLCQIALQNGYTSFYSHQHWRRVGVFSLNHSHPLCACSVTSVLSDSVTLWTVVHQAPLSMRFSKQEYCRGLPCSPPRDLLNPGVESTSCIGRWFLYHQYHLGSPATLQQYPHF